MAETKSTWGRVRVVLNPSEINLDQKVLMLKNLEAFGFLVQLIARASYRGLPTDQRMIGRLAGVSTRTAKRLWPHVESFFKLSEDGRSWELLPSEWFTPQLLSAERRNLTAFLDLLVDYWGPQCVYCGAEGDLEVEHVVPIARGGTNELRNLTVSCPDCNRRKRTKTAAEFGHPHIHAKATLIQ